MNFLSPITRFVYGTTRLGDESIPLNEKVATARYAIESENWIHTSDQYGSAESILKIASHELGKPLPPVICKIGWESVSQIREQILRQIEALGIEKIEIGQLCLGGELAEHFREGNPIAESLLTLRSEGIVNRFVLETWPWNSEVVMDGLTHSLAETIIDGLIFYCNPLQRFVSNDLWSFILENGIPFIAMRTTCGGSLENLIHSEKAPDYLQKRAIEMKPIFENSGYGSWPEFCMHFFHSLANGEATVGSTSRIGNYQDLKNLSNKVSRLPEDSLSDILKVQSRWALEHDQFAAPWSM